MTAQEGRTQAEPRGLGFVGLGNMGFPIARRLLDAGHQLTVYDINADAVQRLVAAGAVAAASVREVGDTTATVLTSLPSANAVTEVTVGESGLVNGKSIKRVVELSTIGAGTTTAIAGQLAAAGVALVDAPVSGGTSGATAGTLAIMAACAHADFEAVEPTLRIFGKPFHVGEVAGMGQTMKLLNNQLSATALVATSEAFVLGAKAGLDPKVMCDVISAGSGDNSAVSHKFPAYVLPGTFDSGFTLALLCKDLRLFAAEAEQLEVPHEVAAAVRGQWEQTLDDLGPGADFTRIVQPIEQAAGAEVRASTQQ